MREFSRITKGMGTKFKMHGAYTCCYPDRPFGSKLWCG